MIQCQTLLMRLMAQAMIQETAAVADNTKHNTTFLKPGQLLHCKVSNN